MKIVKYDRARTTQAASSGSSGGGGGSSTTIEGGSISLDRTIWGKRDTGDDIDGHFICNGDVTIKAITQPNYEDDDDEDGENEEYDTGGGNLNVELKTTTKDLEVTNDVYVINHLYVNHTHSEHKGDKVCLIGEVETNTQNIKKNTDNIAINKTNIETNKKNIASNLSEINALKTRVSTNETNIANNTTAINSLDTNLQIAEQSIKNNADEIVALKNRTTANETAISSLLPVGSIIMFSGTMAEIPEGWAICNGENGTPNLIGKFVKAWTESGQTGGNNSIKLKKTDIPKVRISMNTETFDEYKQMESYQYLNKQIPMLDKVEEGVYDEGGSSHYSLYTGYKKGDNGLVGVPVKEYIMASANFLQAGEEKEYQTSVDIEPSYYSLIYICRIA